MSSKKDKGPVDGGSNVPTYPETPARQAARFLANTARKYLAEKANDADVYYAIELWRHRNDPPRASHD